MFKIATTIVATLAVSDSSMLRMPFNGRKPKAEMDIGISSSILAQLHGRMRILKSKELAAIWPHQEAKLKIAS